MQISRDITKDLLQWKASPRRKPLLLKGVRQCGKSWLLNHFGKTYFDDVICLNFDRQNDLAVLFDNNYDPSELLVKLNAYSGKSILPQKTLLILDEIQLCPRALNALKYFCEEKPEYAIAAAGSLIGLSLSNNQSGFPVGKVDIMELSPCSFHEYLNAINPALAQYISTIPLEPLNEAFANKLSIHLREYLTIGGLPAALDAYIESRDLTIVENELNSIMDAYQSDFSKHIPYADMTKLHLLWQSIPMQFARENRRFFYSEVRSGARAKDLEDAMQWLLNASMIQKINLAENPSSQLASSESRKIFKLYPTDVGVLRKLAHIQPNIGINNPDLFSDFKGRMAENFVLEQLYAMRFSPICYWFNPNGSAEVDFLIQHGEHIIPVEVKSGLSLTAKSLKFYREKYKPKLAVRTSMQNLRYDDGLLNIPLYLISELPRFLTSRLERL